MVDADAVAAVLYRLIESSPDQQVLGSSLAVLLKRAYRDFRPEDFGCKNLRDFVRAYAKEIYEVDRSGSDIVYSISRIPGPQDAVKARRDFLEIATAQQTAKLQLDRRVWKTFVSPNGPFVIWANRSHGTLAVLPATEPSPGEDWVKVPPCAPEVHKQIAREFVGTIQDASAKSQLETVLGLNQSWWEHFFVSARNLGVEKQWSAFRRKRLHDEFEKTLRTLNVPFARRAVSLPATADSGTIDLADPLRRLATAVLGRMSASELRNVWLPLGYVVDELKTK